MVFQKNLWISSKPLLVANDWVTMLLQVLKSSKAKSPTGPWVYGGVLMEEGPCFTNHPGIADFKGHSYLFYHTDELPGGSLFHRSVCVAEFKYNADGSIDTIAKCRGVNAIK